jgi:hypothetical protein
MFPALAATVMSDSRPATELLYAKMMPAEQASKCQGTFQLQGQACRHAIKQDVLERLLLLAPDSEH